MSHLIGRKREIEITNQDDSKAIKKSKSSINSRSDNYGSPKYVIELINDWYLVITSKGDKFYYNKSINISKWTLDENKDSDVIEYIYNNNNNEVDGESTGDSLIRTKIDQFLILIAKARGYIIKTDDNESAGEAEKDEVEKDEVEENKNEIEDIETVPALTEPLPDVDRESGTTTAASADKGNGLNLGYDSSDDSDDSDNSDEEKEQADINAVNESETGIPENTNKTEQDDSHSVIQEGAEDEDEDDEGALRLSDLEADQGEEEEEEEEEEEYGLQLSDLENDEENNHNDDNDDNEEEGKEEYKDVLLELKNEINHMNSNNNLSDPQIKSYLQLFNESKLDPFSSWDLENENVMYNTKYLDIDDDELRRLIFDSWCTIKTKESGDLSGINQTEDDKSSSESVDISNSKSFSQDQDEISNEVYEFIKFLDEYSKNSKLLKYFIEFKRKLKRDKKFQDLELYKSLNFNKMEFFYKNYIKFIKLQNENENEIKNFIINSLESNKNLKKLNFNNLHNINYNHLIELINTNKINSIKSLIYKIIDDDNIDDILYELYREVTLVTFNSDNEINQKLKLISILEYFTNQKIL